MLMILLIIAIFQFGKSIFVRIHGNSRKYICYRYGIAIIIALTLIMISGNGIKKSEISVNYGNDGCICITNTSDYNFGNVDILFYSESGEYIDGISVSKTEVLRAKEAVVTTFEGEENVVWAQAEDSYYEVLHWKYTYDINKLKLVNGKYYVLSVAAFLLFFRFTIKLSHLEPEITKCGIEILWCCVVFTCSNTVFNCLIC